MAEPRTDIDEKAADAESDFERSVSLWINSPAGQVVLAELVKRYSRGIFDSDPLRMARKAGKLEMLQYLDGFRRSA